MSQNPGPNPSPSIQPLTPAQQQAVVGPQVQKRASAVKAAQAAVGKPAPTPTPGVVIKPLSKKQKQTLAGQLTPSAKPKPKNFQKLQNSLKRQQLANLTEFQKLGRNINQLGNAINGRAEAIPSPGGIAVPLILLLVLVTLLIPVGGHTRIEWLYLTLIGHARVKKGGGVTEILEQKSAQGGGGETTYPYYVPYNYEVDEY